jgi:hypothetical protein
MLATYAAAAMVCSVSVLFGQAALNLCGRRHWAWLSPAVGLALLTIVAWATVRLPGEGTFTAIAVGAMVAVLAVLALIRGPFALPPDALRAGAPVALAALVLASLPFLVEGRFGILGTGFNPDMSQHLLATARLADHDPSQLLLEGYPLGPHAIVAGFEAGLGIDPVQGFAGLQIAVAVLACLTALGAFGRLPAWWRLVGALLIGLPYIVASYLAQGAFKEQMLAFYVLAFTLGLLWISRERPRDGLEISLRAVPLALIAAGAAFTYSFPGIAWLAVIAIIWAVTDSLWTRPERRPNAASWPVAVVAITVFVAAVLPELGRMLDFRRFETFDPAGPGLGNLFGQISPFEVLGIWPTGDFRLAAGDGLMPAAGFIPGAALGAALFAVGLRRWIKRRELAVPAALIGSLALYLGARLDSTAYTAAKALVVASPLVMLAIVPAALAMAADGRSSDGRRSLAATAAGGAFAFAAIGCSVLVLVNAPVGPSSYSPGLTSMRPVISESSALVLVPRKLLHEEEGRSYVAWELRGSRSCIVSGVRFAPGPEGRPLPVSRLPRRGIRYVITWPGRGRAPFRAMRRIRRVDGYTLWRRPLPRRELGTCPRIELRRHSGDAAGAG